PNLCADSIVLGITHYRKKTAPIDEKSDALAARFAYILAKIGASSGNDITPNRAPSKKTAKSRRHNKN
ncbi:MAG: hypothetical protein ACPHVN_05310, partial [Luminiphilus sp.]